jgi:hypothetical protein
MKYKIVLFILFLSIVTTNLYPWGEEGHKLITRMAVENLPQELNYLKQWKDFLIEHSLDADERKDEIPDEFHKHFIDIDFYKEFNEGNMITDKEKLISVYGDSIVSKMGVLPWATIETFKNLTKAFEEKNRDKILIYISDLSHYVEDGHQPFHTLLNYDGQLSNQKGIHWRYEGEMINRNLGILEHSVKSVKTEYVTDPLSFVFEYLTKSNSVAPILFYADKLANEYAGTENVEGYYKLLWFRTKYITEIQFNNAVAALASLIYSAWLDAGSPLLHEIN